LSSVRSLALALAAAACGSDAVPDRPPLPVDAALPPGCDYAETYDGTNDIDVTSGAAETTAILIGAPRAICGAVDHQHFDATAQAIDRDAYELRVAPGARLAILIDLTADAALLGALDVELRDAFGAVVDTTRALGTHAILQSTLGPGAYRLVVVARGAADLAAPIPYRIAVTADDFAARCPAATAAPAYTEPVDETLANDVVEIRYAPLPARTLTAAVDDAPEPTGIALAPGAPVRISGTSAALDGADDFQDRDTYLITTGAHDVLAVRVDWLGADADLDLHVFPEDATEPVGRGTTVARAAPETATFPVLRDTRYWLWVGSFDSTTGAPVAYDVTLCPVE
jgi:hypothetical protein